VGAPLQGELLVLTQQAGEQGCPPGTHCVPRHGHPWVSWAWFEAVVVAAVADLAAANTSAAAAVVVSPQTAAQFESGPSTYTMLAMHGSYILNI